jgi:Ni/Co efflux regulator RcnB
MEPDVLYAVRHGEVNAALRYSLRSLGNLPHRRVFIAGFCPSWVRGVTVVEAPRRANKLDSIEENVRRGLRHPELGEHVVYMNDDFYITRPVHCVNVTHGGPIDQYQGQQEFKTRMRQTLRLLRELQPIVTLYSYDGVHMPLPLERELARPILDQCPPGVLWRTWYGNRACAQGTQVLNAKYKGKHPVPTELPTFLSTNAGGLKVLREQLEDVLPKDCEYTS